jgi:hypothetical protein
MRTFSTHFGLLSPAKTKRSYPPLERRNGFPAHIGIAEIRIFPEVAGLVRCEVSITKAISPPLLRRID